MRRIVLPISLLLAAVAAAIALTACGSSTPGTAYGGAKPQAAGEAKAARPATVGTRRTSLGTVLVDGAGRTLYLFEQDKGTTSTCVGGCAGIWPALTATTTPVAAGGASAGKLGSAKRSDGTRIVTYGGHPLYTYAGDGRPGDTEGEGLDSFGAEWYVLAPSGRKIDDD
jgi:predicted lipoprotein with Yx(FWY)xxD motif